MKKFKVKITRTEVYEREVEVEAASKKEACRIAEEREQDNEYYAMFDAPDDVKTTFEPA